MTFLDDFDKFDKPEPSDLGVPHTVWRPNQFDAWHRSKQMLDGDQRFVVLELPTGSGKSAIPTALGAENQIVVYAHSLSLLDQYKEKYGFDIVKGMANYECVNEKVRSDFTERRGYIPNVGQCPFEKMDQCPVYDKCQYIVAREAALRSRRMACTYAFALLSHRVRFRTGIAVWDEAHMAAETITSFSEIMFRERHLRDFDLPRFPMIGVKDSLNRISRPKIVDWLSMSLRKLASNPPSMLFEDDVSAWRIMQRRLDGLLSEVLNEDNPYYFESGLEDVSYSVRGKRYNRRVPYMKLKPLRASVMSWKLMENKKHLLMSATIGDPEPLAEELGIEAYQYSKYPHPVPADKRPVYRIPFDRMTYTNLTRYPSLYQGQALKIAEFIQRFPDDWNGIVTTSSYAKANKLHTHLKRYLGDRVWERKEGVGAVEGYLNEEGATGRVVVDVVQVWGTGLDLAGDLGRFAIVASVPFGNLADPFEEARRKNFKSNYAWWVSYMSVPQAVGRVSRGEITDDGDYLLNVGALADGSAYGPRALSYYPDWFRDAIIEA